MMCQCTCHLDCYDVCRDCAHLHTAEEQVGGNPEPTPECTCACHPTSIGNCGMCKDFHDQAPHVCTPECRGTRDGAGAGDHDQWYVRPVLSWRDHVRALIVRSRLGDERAELRNRGRKAA